VKTVMREGKIGDDRRFKTVQNQISGWLMQNRQPLLSAAIKQDARFSGVSWGEVALQSVIGVPLQIEGAFIGTLILLNKTSGAAFDENDLAYLEKLCLIAAPYLRNVQKIAEYFNTPLPDAALLAKYEQVGLLGKSPPFVELLQAIEAATRCDVRVLLEGQTGTGKELIARAIHQFSARQQQPFIAIDCGAIPANLLESELFGHVKGAFTGATHDRRGLLEEANHGTLFMDEIAHLPVDMQAKFMWVLQAKFGPWAAIRRA
jgi:anaerobic nitric oxide reductase transcription regulator